VLEGPDTFGATVPASAVTDAFAYLVEAYDGAGNGPVRSGSPEEPLAVAIDDAPATATVVAAAPAAAIKAGPAAPAPPQRRNTWWIAGGAAAVAAIGGVVFGLESRRAAQQVERAQTASDAQDWHVTAKRNATAANVLYGTAGWLGAIAAASLVFRF
jgi:hypothetical protein